MSLKGKPVPTRLNWEIRSLEQIGKKNDQGMRGPVHITFLESCKSKRYIA